MTEPQGTPLTDAAALDCCGSSENDADGGKALVTADFARALERTIAGLREELREAGYNYEGAMSDRRMWRERCETAERQLEAQTLFHKELREFHNACIVDMYEMLGIDGSDGELRYKWCALGISSLKLDKDKAEQQLAEAQREREKQAADINLCVAANARYVQLHKELREQLAERDVRISELENVECGQAALVNKLMSVEAFVWKVTTPAGDSCHFGDESGALAYARETGTVERIRLAPRNFHIVSAELANRAGKEPS